MPACSAEEGAWTRSYEIYIHYRHAYDTITTVVSTLTVFRRVSSTQGDGIECAAGEFLAVTEVCLPKLIGKGRTTQGRAWPTNCIAHRLSTLRCRSSPQDTSLPARGRMLGKVVRLCLFRCDRAAANVVRLCLFRFAPAAEDMLPEPLNQTWDMYVSVKLGRRLMQRCLNWFLSPRRPCFC